jgi:hypothetical protein
MALERFEQAIPTSVRPQILALHHSDIAIDTAPFNTQKLCIPLTVYAVYGITESLEETTVFSYTSLNKWSF